MTLEDLGYNNLFEEYRQINNLESFSIARVAKEHKERYTVIT